MKINETTIREACNLLAETLIQKNHDYGNSVEEQFKEYGETSLLIRLDDKLRRLKQLQKASAKVKTETKQDTFFDLAGYSILDFILLSSEEEERVYEIPKEGFLPMNPKLNKSYLFEEQEARRNYPREKYDINFNPHFDQNDQN